MSGRSRRRHSTQKLLTLLEDATVRMEDHAVIRVRNDTGLRVDPGDGLVHAMQGNQGQQGGNRSPLWRPCDGRRDMAVFQDPCFEPGFALPADGGGCLRFGEQSIMVNAVKRSNILIPLSINPPIDDPTEVEVTDPTHPLFGRRFALLSTRPRPHSVGYLFVGYRDTMVLRISQTATNVVAATARVGPQCLNLPRMP